MWEKSRWPLEIPPPYVSKNSTLSYLLSTKTEELRVSVCSVDGRVNAVKGPEEQVGGAAARVCMKIIFQRGENA